MLHLAPRLPMGALAVVDTFLIYKIAERRYNNRNIVFMTAILFAAMPMSWLVRRILLDSLILPFLNLKSAFKICAFIATYLPSQDKDNEDKSIMMGSNWMQIFSWIPYLTRL